MCLVIFLASSGPWRVTSPRVVALLLCTFVLGVYRFSLAQPSLPRGLIFADPRGLAMGEHASRAASHLDPRHWLARLRVVLRARANVRFSPDQAALLTGILYGEKGFTRTAKDAFRQAGLLHLVAVSGSNMTIIVTLVMRLFLSVRCTRRRAFYATLLAIGLFVLFVGPSASVVRAAMMGILVELAPIVGRLVRPTRLLLISALLFTLWHPWALVFDPSFALSFLAMLGLLTYGRWLSERLVYLRAETLRDILSSTLAATIFTAPYAAWAFGSFTFWGLLTNTIALPLVPWAMLFGLMALLLPPASFFPLKLFVLSAEGILETILWTSHIPAYVGVGFLHKVFLPLPWMLVSYIVIIFVYTEGIKKISPPVSLRGELLDHSDAEYPAHKKSKPR